MQYLGETLALASAVFWGGGVILFRISGRKVHPLGLNLFKNSLALLLLLLTMLLAGETILHPAPWKAYWIMLVSGAIGFAVADTLYFHCLNLLGAGLTAIAAALYSPSIIGLSLLFLGESLSVLQAFGVLLIVSAVLLIGLRKDASAPPRRTLFLGIALAVLAQLGTAVSVVMMKPVLNETPLLWATIVRLAGGILFLGILLALHPERRSIFVSLAVKSHWKPMVPASLLGTYLAIMTWMGGMKYTQASIAAALSQLSTVFIFILAAVFLKEKTTSWKWAAVGMAVAGAVLASAL